MSSILALAALGTWSYAGFLAQPPPAPVPPVPPARPGPIEPGPGPPPVPPASPGPVKPPRQPPTDATRTSALIPPPVPPRSTAPAVPTLYRLADLGGQIWEHADPSFLRNFVEARNRSFVPQLDRLLPSRAP